MDKEFLKWLSMTTNVLGKLDRFIGRKAIDYLTTKLKVSKDGKVEVTAENIGFIKTGEWTQ